ncbi:MAG: DUF1622 domain-containing protein [Acidobacteriota bacterium]|nr:DUF1622 domain-containing protein [Acidobacteriota bacterium]
MDRFRAVMEIVGTAVDAAGVTIVVIGAALATVWFAFFKPPAGVDRYRFYRQNLGKAILLGLEFLVAGEIIRTVVVAPTLNNVLILGVIVLIRTFLSMALELEIAGNSPWKRSVSLGLKALQDRPHVS